MAETATEATSTPSRKRNIVQELEKLDKKHKAEVRKLLDELKSEKTAMMKEIFSSQTVFVIWVCQVKLHNHENSTYLLCAREAAAERYVNQGLARDESVTRHFVPEDELFEFVRRYPDCKFIK